MTLRRSMKVEEVMVRDVKFCTSDDSLNHAAQIMWETDCGCVPVTDNDGRAIGMLTDRDICMAAFTQGATLNALRVSDSMSRELFGCRPDDDLLAAQQVMREHRVRRLPVMGEAGKVIAIISLTDVARAVARTHSAAGKAKVADTLVTICAAHPQELAAQSSRTQRERRKKPTGEGRRRVAPRSGASTETPGR